MVNLPSISNVHNSINSEEKALKRVTRGGLLGLSKGAVIMATAGALGATFMLPAAGVIMAGYTLKDAIAAGFKYDLKLGRALKNTASDLLSNFWKNKKSSQSQTNNINNSNKLGTIDKIDGNLADIESHISKRYDITTPPKNVGKLVQQNIIEGLANMKSKLRGGNSKWKFWDKNGLLGQVNKLDDPLKKTDFLDRIDIIDKQIEEIEERLNKGKDKESSEPQSSIETPETHQQVPSNVSSIPEQQEDNKNIPDEEQTNKEVASLTPETLNNEKIQANIPEQNTTNNNDNNHKNTPAEAEKSKKEKNDTSNEQQNPSHTSEEVLQQKNELQKRKPNYNQKQLSPSERASSTLANSKILIKENKIIDTTPTETLPEQEKADIDTNKITESKIDESQEEKFNYSERSSRTLANSRLPTNNNINPIQININSNNTKSNENNKEKQLSTPNKKTQNTLLTAKTQISDIELKQNSITEKAGRSIVISGKSTPGAMIYMSIKSDQPNAKYQGIYTPIAVNAKGSFSMSRQLLVKGKYKVKLVAVNPKNINNKSKNKIIEVTIT